MTTNNRPARSRIRVRAGNGGPPSVDGHPGWVRQSIKQYVWLCVCTMAMQGFLIGAGPVLAGAHSAAWWMVAAGAFCSLAVWIPVWGMMRGKEAVSLDEAFREAYGKVAGGIVTFFYIFLTLFNAVIALRAVGSMVRQYLFMQANEMVVILFMMLTLAFTLIRHGSKGASRFNWMMRRIVVYPLLACCLFMLQNASLDNLFPVLGNSVEETLMTLPMAMSGFSGIVMLGLLPPQTGSAKPVRFRTGVFALLLGGIFATILMLVTNLCMPPRAVLPNLIWGHQLMIPAEYMENRIFRFIYFILLMLLLAMTVSNSITNGSLLMHRTFGAKKGNWCVALLSGILLAASLQTNQSFMDHTVEWMVYRLPVAALPAWITWGVLLIKRRRKGKEGAAA